MKLYQLKLDKQAINERKKEMIVLPVEKLLSKEKIVQGKRRDWVESFPEENFKKCNQTPGSTNEIIEDYYQWLELPGATRWFITTISETL